MVLNDGLSHWKGLLYYRKELYVRNSNTDAPEIYQIKAEGVMSMKRVLGLLVAGIVICVGFTACGNDPELGNETGVVAVEKESVSVDYLDDVKGQYLNYVDASEIMKVNSSEYETVVLFHADGDVEDFRVFSLELNIDENGILNPIATEVFRAAELKKDAPVAVPLKFPGDMSLNGFCYKGPDGNLKTFTIGISGKDGSLVVNEESFAVPE